MTSSCGWKSSLSLRPAVSNDLLSYPTINVAPVWFYYITYFYITTGSLFWHASTKSIDDPNPAIGICIATLRWQRHAKWFEAYPTPMCDIVTVVKISHINYMCVKCSKTKKTCRDLWKRKYDGARSCIICPFRKFLWDSLPLQWRLLCV